MYTLGIIPQAAVRGWQEEILMPSEIKQAGITQV